jgi:hypothetical protein
MSGIYLVCIKNISDIYHVTDSSLSLSGFRALLQARADPPQQDMPDDHLPDPDDNADFELPDQQALIDAFTAGLCKESQHDFRSLSTLLATLPDPSLSHSHVEAIPVTKARE